MLCYRDRTYCQENLCGDPDCSRILTEEDRQRAIKLDLPIAYAMPCLNPKKEQDDSTTT